MRLQHLNLTTSDVSALAAFFERFFGFEPYAARGDALVVLRNGHDFILTVMRGKTGEPADYPANFHIGFYYDEAIEVEAKHAELSAAGLSPNKIAFMDRGGGARIPHFYCAAPGNVLIEVCTPPGGLAP
ncbi:VOC family protein [Bradyrhizobium sp. 21]|uniref:VOC family protein n=1 Tax=Bradyrhizobium sp. 21 TaxID=2782666 RepID=UPI001FF7F35B|nr:VOC family protein [Bradyrhizobium sp. 21]MCK1388808.1 VOC family protein [Bradyrhizobium sp. 21]